MRVQIAALVLLSGCQGLFGNGGQSGEDTIVCRAVETQDLADDEVSPLGFAPADLLVYAAGDHADTLDYDAGGSTALQIGLVSQGARFEDREWVDDGTGELTDEVQAELGCEDAVVIDAALSFATDDGQFDEAADVSLEAAYSESAQVFADFDPDSLGGSYQLDFDPADYDDVRIHLLVEFDENGTTGEIAGDRSQTQGDVASDEMFAIGTF